MADTATKLTTQIASVTAAITALISLGQAVYPYVIILLKTLKDLIDDMSGKMGDVGDLVATIYTNIEKAIDTLEEALAKEGLVSDDEVAKWLLEIDQNVQVIKAAAAD